MGGGGHWQAGVCGGCHGCFWELCREIGTSTVGPRVAVVCCCQAVLMFAPTAFIFTSPMAPLPSSVGLIVTVVLFLKSHRWVRRGRW